ncbi:hypothetical protein COCCADRAFT_25523 [Bipolaris zeicola 26-R-13]|uniref:Uncharacterized protein n=1 Tax=Cochliobolus carbonum (strain 26-R-13) TaxID=930089 RepID=W6YFV0_COCC2|nr:uncharacterized protein COCCADRAFT_25523 [Bipolaris zeicola 26-R-13]EUC34334.1 hypothetical protein COCCADRAFT_25523 [Bipolaris zeicola 26-R-13]
MQPGYPRPRDIALSSKKPRVTVRCYDLEMRPTADGLGLSLLFQAHVTNVLTKDSANAQYHHRSSYHASLTSRIVLFSMWLLSSSSDPTRNIRSDLLACVEMVGIRRGSRRRLAQTSFTGPSRVFSLLFATLRHHH